MKMRVRKLPILIPVLLIAALLAGAAYMMIQRNQAADISHTDLGNKHLAELDYSGAVTEFAESLAQNPTDVIARVGLATAYMNLGESDAAVSQVLQPLLDNQNPDAYRLILEMQCRENDIDQALITAQKLVHWTDSPDDYAIRDQLLQQLYAQNRSYAHSSDHSLYISRSNLFASGSNLIGQFGIDTGFASNQPQESFIPVIFPATPKKVYCGSQTSYVVDTSGNLWAAGENRWGQMGLNTITLTGQPEWLKIVDTGDVAAVAATTGLLYVLRTDGSLWYAGLGGVTALARISEFQLITSIAASGNTVALLTVDGNLYSKTHQNSNNASGWTLSAKNVKQFSLNEDGMTWITVDNEICHSYSRLSVPENWRTGDRGYFPPFTVRQAIYNDGHMFLLDTIGKLHHLYNGSITECATASVSSIYAEQDMILFETDQGPYWWRSTDADPLAIPAP